jgi:hypothetical protein
MGSERVPILRSAKYLPTPRWTRVACSSRRPQCICAKLGRVTERRSVTWPIGTPSGANVAMVRAVERAAAVHGPGTHTKHRATSGLDPRVNRFRVEFLRSRWIAPRLDPGGKPGNDSEMNQIGPHSDALPDPFQNVSPVPNTLAA